MIEIETTTRYTATCHCCKNKITAAYRLHEGKTLRDVEEDFEWHEWQKLENGLWLCPECAEINDV